MRTTSLVLALLLMVFAAPASSADDAISTNPNGVIDLTVKSAANPVIAMPKWKQRVGFYPGDAANGDVAVKLVIATDGSVTDLHVFQSSGTPAFDSTFVDYLGRQHFEPASLNGKPVAVRMLAVAVTDAATKKVTMLIAGISDESGDCASLVPQVAVPACTAWIAAGNDDALTRIRRAHAYVVLDRDDDALADLKAAEKLNARGGEISRLRGFIEEKRGDYQTAIDDYSDAMKAKGGFAVATIDRGLTYEALGRADLVAADFKVAASMGSACGEGDCQAKADAQIAALDARIAQNPNDISAFANRCVQRSISGRQLSMGLADCNHVQDRLASEPNTLEARGLIFLRMGQFADAIQDLSTVLAAEPKRATSLYFRGIAKLKSGNAAAAHADFLAARYIDSSVAARMAFNGILPG